ncbi:hypothetical protein F2Q70_00011885 [Brassica cretica]|uniref:Uncharacterized protein n=1 Tax=Brassica cretica TaxID=69181 RepID=A0A8S9MEV6_BRACR|nr:hypothetical protein F2Q70_00011885 [Brassica cretica]
MWFPIPEAIVCALDHFELSISQLNVAALQNFLGVLILSYKLRMDLSPDDFEGLWSTRKTSIDYSYHMDPKRHMSIIQRHTSNAKLMAHLSRRTVSPCSVANGTFIVVRWLEICILPATPRDLFAKHDLLRNGPFFWESFTLDRIRNAVALYRSRSIFRPLRASDMDEPHPDAVPDQRERARLSHFKAEEIKRNFIRFQNKVAEREHIQAESHSRALIRAERKGRRAIAAELARRATLFDAVFRSLKDAQGYMGDFRECRGSAESMVPPIEGRIRELWEPIEAGIRFDDQVFYNFSQSLSSIILSETRHGYCVQGPKDVLRELRRGCTVSGQEVGPRPWAR